jgi:hypothetical protein
MKKLLKNTAPEQNHRETHGDFFLSPIWKMEEARIRRNKARNEAERTAWTWMLKGKHMPSTK